MLKYGGVYLDTDAFFVRPLTDQLRAYDVVVSYDWVDWDLPFPDTLNLGVTVSKPGARFWELCLVSYCQFQARFTHHFSGPVEHRPVCVCVFVCLYSYI